MPDETAIDAWLDLWEDLRGRGEGLSPDEFAARHCGGAPPALVEGFRAKALALLSIDADLRPAGNRSTGGEGGDTGPSGPMGRLLAEGSEPVPGYRLVRRLGRGGYGEVWEAAGPGGFPVALKFVRLGDGGGGAAERGALELLKRLRHPHLLAVFGTWQEGGRLAVACELGEGTLADRLRECRARGLPGVPAAELLRRMAEAVEGLDYLNAAGVQHRDVKPQNLLLVGGSAKVADYGLAKLLEGTHASHSGPMTAGYAAPEFFGGRTSAHSDQYSLAVSYCELRGGRLPFAGSALELMRGHAHEPPDLSMLPEEERGAVARALSKRPEDRWPSCADFAERLAAAGSARPGAAAETPAAVYAPSPTPGGAAEVITNSVGMRLALIPAGKFLRGSPSADVASSKNERPRREIEIGRPFHLGVFPVTQGQYRRVMGSRTHLVEADDLPVVSVSHEQAIAFCNALSGLPEERLAGRLYRLPTEAEWEYACRAGAGPYQPFHTGNSLSHDQANFGGKVGRTSPVGSYPANAWGLHDMHGNVWEWCSDWYDEGYYEASPEIDPPGPARGKWHVRRGGSWYNRPWHCRSAHRPGVPPVHPDRYGFRVVCDAKDDIGTSPLQSNERGMRAGVPETQDLGVRITSPAQGAAVPLGWLEVSGTHDMVPDADVRLFHLEEGTKYYPHEKVVFRPDGAWSGRVSVGGEAGQKTVILAAAVGETLRKAIEGVYEVQGASTASGSRSSGPTGRRPS